MALTCRWRSRPQHQKRKWKSATNWVYASSNVISCASGLPWGLRVLAERRASDEFAFSVATAPTTARHRQLAFGVVIATLVAYVVIVVPNAAIPLPRTDSFVPAVFAVIFVADLVTAVLLYAQFSATGSRPLLVLASGYLFSSLIVVGHALTYPGAFAPTVFLGPGLRAPLGSMLYGDLALPRRWLAMLF